MSDETETPLKTPLFALHEELGAKMVPFAGYAMPVSYPLGVMKEHLHTRAAAGLFDVSHMGQVRITGPDADLKLEALVPVDVVGLKDGRQRYGFFTTEDGGIIDDLMISRHGDALMLVVNASRKAVDLAHLRAGMPGCAVKELADRALIALQGPAAETALSRLVPGVASMRFMDYAAFDSAFGPLTISRSGYTGEDGYEVSVAADRSEDLARALLAMEEVEAIGLGARDSLRLEAGLCLYGHDISEETGPIGAGLSWAIQKVRRTGGARAGGFPAADDILAQLEAGPKRCRVGLRPEGRAPMRDDTLLFAAEGDAESIGFVTSGGFGPSVGAPIAMGYVPAGLSAPGTRLWGEVRGKRLPVTVADLPFHPHSYKR